MATERSPDTNHLRCHVYTGQMKRGGCGGAGGSSLVFNQAKENTGLDCRRVINLQLHSDKILAACLQKK